MNRCWKGRVKKLHTPEKVEEECVVVIDVIRAFTTAAYAFSKGAKQIVLVSKVEEAFRLKKEHPDWLLMGEEGGFRIEGFDFGNSPVEIGEGSLEGKTLVQRTSAGTQGATRSVHSKRVFASSFVVAQATVNQIVAINPSCVTFVITGSNNGDEDLALADYLEKCLLNGSESPQSYLDRVRASPEGQMHLSEGYPHFPKDDIEAVVALDAFPFAMWMDTEWQHPVLRTCSEKVGHGG